MRLDVRKHNWIKDNHSKNLASDNPGAIQADWIEYLREEMLWENDDPLFPATQVGLGESRKFQAIGLQRVHWSNASRIRAIFLEAFTNADLSYFNPHSFRNTLARLGIRKLGC